MAGFKAAPQRCGSAPGLITPGEDWGLPLLLEPRLTTQQEGPPGGKELDLTLLPSFYLLPRLPHWPGSVGSQKTKGPGDIIRLGQPRSRPQSRIAGEAGEAIGGCPAQHVSENIYLSRQEEEWEMLPEPCRQRKRGVGVFRESRRSLRDRSLCCCCCRTLCDPMDYTAHWNSPGQNTGVSSLSLLQGIFPTQGLNPGLPHC